MSDSDVVIRVEGLGKRYSLHHAEGQRRDTFREMLTQRARLGVRLLNPFTFAGQLRKAQREHNKARTEHEEEFWALKDGMRSGGGTARCEMCDGELLDSDLIAI